MGLDALITVTGSVCVLTWCGINALLEHRHVP